MFTDEYLNPDGTRTFKESVSEPLNVKDSSGAWQPVDTGLVTEPSGRLRPRRHPLNPSLGARGDDAALVSVEVEGKRAWLALDQAAAARATVDSGRVGYAEVRPDTDLNYDVTPGSVKETIRLKKPPTSASWRFRLGTNGLTPRLTDGGAVLFTDAAGAVAFVMPPIETWDSSGSADHPPAVTGGRYRLEQAGAGWVLTVSVDEAWLRDPRRVYPVGVDPTFTFDTADDAWAFKSDGVSCELCGLRFGNPLDRGFMWRSTFHINVAPLFGKTVVGTKLDLISNRDPAAVDKTFNADLYHSCCPMGPNGVGVYLGSALVGQVGTFDNSFTWFLRNQIDAGRGDAWYLLIGAETPDVWTYKNMHLVLSVDTGTAPPVPSLVAPADNSVLTSLSPTLSVSPVSDPDGDPVKYCFKVATGPDAKSGVVVDSGCLSTSNWTVPPGVLHDGVAYTWQATVVSGVTRSIPSWVGHFRVDQRIGDHGPAPVDSLGSVTVNLANGNVLTSAASPTFTTVGGTAGVSMTYNSQQQAAKGLRATYFNDLSHTGNINDGQQPVLVRAEPQVNVDFNRTSPFPPALGADWFVVRWEGFFQPPATGTYQFAGVHDDRLRVWVNNQVLYDAGCCSDVNWGAPGIGSVALTAGDRVPIKIELAQASGPAYLKLFTRTTDGTTVPAQLVPADWLFSADSPALPTGWTLSADLDGSGTTYTEAKVTDQSIVLTDATGAKHTWTKKSTGGFTPPAGEDGVLSLDTAGRVTVTEGADVSVFRADGKLDTQSSALDSRHPAALQNLYDGNPVRLREIRDPVSGRSHRLYYNRPGDDCYGGVTPPAGADPLPPQQMLCRIAYWDGTQTRLWYFGGRLRRIEDPGSEITDYYYDANGLLTSVRDPLATDWVAVDYVPRNVIGTYTTIGYTTLNGRVQATRVTAPEPSPGASRPAHAYRYDPANLQTFVDVAGLNPAIGFATRVTYDDAWRLLSTTDATGRTSSQTWDVKDLQLTATDPAGRMSTTVYDYADRPTDKYGPAPASCFSGQQPTAACAGTVPRTHTAYDEGMQGLSVAYYANNALAGAPKVYATGITGATGGMLARDWATTAPDPAIPADNWSARFTGEVQFPDAGTYTLSMWADDGVRLWVNDQLVIDDWIVTESKQRTATWTSPAAGTTARIRVEYFDGGGNALVSLWWARPGLSTEKIPGQYLRPRYGLTTSTVASESDGVPDQQSVSRYDENGLDPVYGLATSTVAGGLTARSGHEPPGSGYLRRTSKTMPTGAVSAYTHYGDTEARANPCVAGSPAVNQGGLPKLATSVSPAVGPARVDEQVYDGSGRVVAKSTSGDWSCTVYDARDRVVSQTFPAPSPRTVTTNYAVGGDPLTTSVTDNRGTITTQVDLLGRAVAYTDVYGLRTAAVYDQAGRVSSETVTPPNPADPPQVTSYTYDDAGRGLTVQLGATVLATSSYDSAGELASVLYSNSSSLSSIARDSAGRVVSLGWRTSDNVPVTSAVTRTRSGTVVDETLAGVDARPGAPNYVYDAAGRLTEAWVAGHHYTYDFATAAPAACPSGSVVNAGLNTNRVRLVDATSSGSAETGYCYDAADRILGTTGTSVVSSFAYDRHGNTLSYIAGGATTSLGWDGADRNVSARVTGADPADITYTRDALDRIVRRDASTGDTTATVIYAYTGSGDSADVALTSDLRLATRSLSLPGGALYTLRPGTPASWDHPTVRGDLCLTTDPTGHQTGGLRTYTPFGEPLTPAGTVDPDAVPDNQPGSMDHGWLGQHQRPTEHAGALSLVQMGARPYNPMLARFLSVDPIEGGSANDYDYVAADPINTTDLDGNSRKCPLWRCPPQGSNYKVASRGRSWISRIWMHSTTIWHSRYHKTVRTYAIMGRAISMSTREYYWFMGKWMNVAGNGCSHSRSDRSCWNYQSSAARRGPARWDCFGLGMGMLAGAFGMIASAGSGSAPGWGASLSGFLAASGQFAAKRCAR